MVVGQKPGAAFLYIECVSPGGGIFSSFLLKGSDTSTQHCQEDVAVHFVVKQDVSEHVSLPALMMWWPYIGLKAAPQHGAAPVHSVSRLIGGSPGCKRDF